VAYAFKRFFLQQKGKHEEAEYYRKAIESEFHELQRLKSQLAEEVRTLLN